MIIVVLWIIIVSYITVILSFTFIAANTEHLQRPGDKETSPGLQIRGRVRDFLCVLLFNFTIVLFKGDVRFPQNTFV